MRMKMYANLEDYSSHIRQETSSLLAGLCRELGPTHEITVRVADLCTEAATQLHQRRMLEEQAGEYDLAALVATVDPDRASNSETGWEREE